MFFGTIFPEIYFHSVDFLKMPLQKAQKTQPLSNSIQLGAFAQSTFFVLTSFFVIVQYLNIARIANAVQVTICLLVSTSVY